MAKKKKEIKQDKQNLQQEWLKRDRLRLWWERKFRAPFQQALKDQIKPVLDAITERGVEYVQSDLELLVDPNPVLREYKRLYTEVGIRFARMAHDQKAGTHELELKQGDGWEDIWRQEMERFFDEQGAAMVTEVTNTSIELVRNKIKEIVANTDTMGVDATARAIRRELQSEYFGKTAGYRSKRIAQTEVLKASNHSQIMATEQLGYDYTKTWVTGGKSKTERHTTYPGLHGQTVGKDELFSVGGYDMSQPGDSSHGAPASEIINCKCIVVTNLKI